MLLRIDAGTPRSVARAVIGSFAWHDRGVRNPPEDDVTREFFLSDDARPTEEFRRVEHVEETHEQPMSWGARAKRLALALAIVVVAASLLALPRSTGTLVTAVAVVQLGLCAVWVYGARPEMPIGFLITAVGTAAAANVVALLSEDKSLESLALVAAGGFGLAIVVQLARGRARHRVTMTLGQHVTGVVAVVGLTSVPMLLRFDGGAVLARVAVLSAGIALATAYTTDLVFPKPAVHRDIARGFVGMVCALIAGAVAGMVLLPKLADAAFDDLNLGQGMAGALLGGVIAFVAVITDMSVAYEAAGRPRIASRARQLALAGFGPLLGLAVVGPACYLIGPSLLSW